jgi:hypothetical protein
VTHAFISYKREDEVRVGRIARALEKVGLPLWWDRSLLSAKSWHEDITEHLESAGCVIVVWSEASVGPAGSFVRDEARNGLHRNILVPVKIDRVKAIPLGFGEVQAIDLTHWKGDVRDPFFRDLVAAVQAKLEGQPTPPSIGPKHRLARRLTYGAISSSGIALVSAFAINAFGVTAKICSLPPPQPTLADACGAMHIGDQPTRAERLAWDAIPKGDCQALRNYVRDYPGSPLRSRAADLITAGEKGGPWVTTTREVPLYVEASDGQPMATEAAERADALERAKGDADQACRLLGAGTVFRYTPGTASVKVEKWSCDQTDAGYACGFSGWAECPVQSQVERCG